MKTIDILNFSNFFIVFGNYLEISWAQLQIRQHCKSIAISNFSHLFFGFPTKIIVIFNFSNFFICFCMKTIDILNFSNFLMVLESYQDISIACLPKSLLFPTFSIVFLLKALSFPTFPTFSLVFV